MSEQEKNTPAAENPTHADQATPDTAATPATEVDINEEVAGLYAEVEALKSQAAQVESLQAKNTELSEQFLRAKAESENIRRRAEEDIAKARKFSIENFAQDLLAVADSLDAALAIESATTEQLIEGTKATQAQLQSVFDRNKLQTIQPEVGSKFDPHSHQAISSVPSEQEPNTIVTVLQKGYQISDRILRPALVVVAASK